ncbi:MAG: hypothetical protein V4584_05820 [Verrucomicrobiota bacterium]
MIPRHLPESVTIPETPLRSLNGRYNSVRLTWEMPGNLTLTHRDGHTGGAIIEEPVTIEGRPPAISFEPEALADASQSVPPCAWWMASTPG